MKARKLSVSVRNIFSIVIILSLLNALLPMVAYAQCTATITLPNGNTVCNSTSVPIAAQFAGSNFKWFRNGIQITGSASSINVTQAGTYHCTATISGCSGTRTSNSVTVTDNTPDVSYTTTTAPYICVSGEPVTFKYMGTQTTGLQWRKNSVAITNATGVTYTTFEPGNYSITVTKNGCSKTSTQTTITSYNMSSSIWPSGYPGVCGGSTVTLNVTSGYSGYQWYRNGVQISGANSATYSASSGGLYKAMLYNGPCVVTTGEISVSNETVDNVTITPSGSTNICEGGSVMLNPSPQGPWAWQWRKDGVPTGVTSPNYQATSSGVYTVLASFGGCSALSSSAVQVTVTPLPSASITGNLFFCTGGETILSAPAGYTYQWYKDGVLQSGKTSQTLAVNAPGNYAVRTASGTCQTLSSPVAVTERLLPEATINGLNAFCHGSATVLTAATGVGYSYQWKKDNSTIAGATGNTYEVNEAGSYTVTVSANGCEKTSAAKVVTETPLPVASIEVPENPFICPGLPTTLQAVTGSGFSYQWRKNNEDIAGGTNSSYQVTSTGNYSVRITASNCSAESDSILIQNRQLPETTITGTKYFCNDDSTTVSIEPLEGYTYQWLKDGEILTGKTGTQLVVDESSFIQVLISDGACVDTAASAILTELPIPDAIIGLSGDTLLWTGQREFYTVVDTTGADAFTWEVPPSGTISYMDPKQSKVQLAFSAQGNHVIRIHSKNGGCWSNAFQQIIHVEGSAMASNRIPEEVKASRDKKLPVAEPTIPKMLNEIEEDEAYNVFEGCLDGKYHVGFQLQYDLGDRNTTIDWSTFLQISLLHEDDTLWTKPLQVDITSQTFIATIFHDSAVSCTDDYRYAVTRKYLTGEVPLENVYLHTLLFRMPEANFDPQVLVSLECPTHEANDHHSVGWNYSGKGAQEFDLEWVFINDNGVVEINSPEEAFQSRAGVGVTIQNALVYKHQVYYPDGKMWYRIRAVGYNPEFPEHRILGRWSYDPCGVIIIHNHDTLRNWQEQTVFAEEGKYKKVMNYFDGSLRQRQAQTNLSSEEVTVVGESLYDFEGRESVNMMAVPTTTNSLHYHPGFNVFSSADTVITNRTDASRKKFHYDNYKVPNSLVSSAAGAGQYYSSNNASTGIHRDFIPDAEGYVFSQTEYLNDGTGRISRQSGVGKAFAMDGDHTTRYHYGGAAPAELIRLFGSNVGNATHYKKNLIVDANGQVSVTYLDQEGRTIATALAGDPPANVDSLQSFKDLMPAHPVTVDITSMNKKESGSSTTTHKILNEAPETLYTFTYDLSALGSNVSMFGCQHCVFDLKITITDPDGYSLKLDTISGNQSDDDFAFEIKNISAEGCVNPMTIDPVTIAVMFKEIGDYTISKQLQVHELSFDQMYAIVGQEESVQNAFTLIRNTYQSNPQDCEICTTGPEAEQAIENAIDEVTDMDCENIYNQIVQYYQDRNNTGDSIYVVPQDSIEEHDLYCKYLLCVKDKESDKFEKHVGRIRTWSEATTKGYNDLFAIDPFFRQLGLSGYNHKQSMSSKLNSVYVAKISYDVNGDKVEDGSKTYRGPITEVINPDETDYFINSNGMHDASAGRHILYLDLQNRRSQLGEVEYQRQVDEQRWSLYKGFYLEAKRKVKLSLYDDCPAALDDLKKTDNMPTNPDAIPAWAEANGLYDSAGTQEIESSLIDIRSACGTTFSSQDSAVIAWRLKRYFNSNRSNFLKLIFAADVGVNRDLQSIDSILVEYDCDLSKVAMVDPLSCAKDTVVILPKNIIVSTFESEQTMMFLENEEPSESVTALANTDRQDEVRGQWSLTRIHNDDSVKNDIRRTLETLLEEQITEEPETIVIPMARMSGVTMFSSALPDAAEYAALWDLYNYTGGTGWTNKGGWSSADPEVVTSVSGWTGITVDASGHITAISLAANNLVGTLPGSLADLTYLTTINVSNNSLFGTIPTQLADLSAIASVNVSRNRFTFAHLLPFRYAYNGTFTYSNQFYQQTVDYERFVDLNRNQTLILKAGVDTTANPQCLYRWASNGGSFSTWTEGGYTYTAPNPYGYYVYQITHSDLPGLTLTSNAIHINNYDCESTIQQEREALIALFEATNGSAWNEKTNWGTGSSLATWFGVDVTTGGYVKSLILENNNLVGYLPAQIGQLCHAESIVIIGNPGLTGGLPAEMSNLRSLHDISLNDNGLSGTIPPAALNGTFVNISNNHFSGDLYPALGWMNHIDCRNNNFTFENLYESLYTLCDVEGGSILYAPQKEVDEIKTIAAAEGQNVILSTSIDRNVPRLDDEGNGLSKYQWFRNGVALQQTPTPMFSGHTVVLPAVTANDQGEYYYEISSFYGRCSEYSTDSILVLRSHVQTVVVDTTLIARTICVAYDTTNSTVAKFSFTVNLNDEIQKCLANAAIEDSILSSYAVERLMEDYLTEYYNQHRTQCLDKVKEHLDYTYTSKEYHYTLYYYDQAGNLVQTVPPAGVHPLTPPQVTAFLAGTKTEPKHNLITRYQYGSLNQLVWQETPDAGQSNFYYNDKGQLKLSQNAQQYKDGKYSYTKYDEQGRVTEVGEMETTLTLGEFKDSLQQNNFPASGLTDVIVADITRTHYDFAKPSVHTRFNQQYLRTRVAWVEVLEKGASDTIATYYTYDIHGNVKALLQQQPGLSDKRTDYLYDLVSGKVNYVFYQYGKHDQFAHHYEYDGDNRLTAVFTSTDRFLWNREASYYYYQHGPLARVELGAYSSQGVDYYYTLQGWTKGVNQPYADDADVASYDVNVGKDAYAYALGYYQNDYKAIKGGYATIDERDHLWIRLNGTLPTGRAGATHDGLYNGNISWMVTDLAKIGGVKNDRTKGMQAMLYKYDQLHRIKKSRSLTGYSAANGFAPKANTAYDETYTYDGNGNILTLHRMNAQGQVLHDYDYYYYKNSNKLRGVLPIVRDTVYSATINSNNKLYRDILVQGTARPQIGTPAELRATRDITVATNFEAEEGNDFAAYIPEDGPFIYDAIGNLIEDEEEGSKISWTPYGKVRTVKTKNDSITVSFRYDATGNRIERRVEKFDTVMVTRYVRDASGNVMSIYKDTTVMEMPVYGSSRLGMYTGEIAEGTQTLGRRSYELSNHLGNVLTVVTDNINMQADTAWGNVLSTNDYYPFGLEMEGRCWADTTSLISRYAFNGKEKDDFGSVVYDYGFRIYNPAIAKFLSVDPLTKNYPWYTPYQFAGNKPIWKIDLDGAEEDDSDANMAPSDYLNPIYKGKAGDMLGTGPVNIIDAFIPFSFPFQNQAKNFAKAVDGKFSFEGRGYKVVLNDHSLLWNTIKEELNNSGYTLDELSDSDITDLKAFYWETNQDRSDLFAINPYAPKLAQVVPISIPMPITIPIFSTGGTLMSESAIYVNANTVAKDKVSIFLSKKTGVVGYPDEFGTTNEELAEQEKILKDRQTANHGKLTKEDKALAQKLKAHRKWLGLENKQKRASD
ncbi:MAG TPA: RHS repeat-associated core domain-containing protein [Ohtaekwangia sp.]